MNVECVLDEQKPADFALDNLTCEGLSLSLARKVRQVVEFSNGTFFTFVSESLFKEDKYDFKSGGKVDGDGIDPDEWLVCKLQKIAKMDATVFAIENWRANVTGLPNANPLLFSHSYNNDVIHIIPAQALGRGPYWIQLCSNTVPVFLGFLCRPKLKPISTEISTEVLDSLATSVSAIVFGAYDGESYVVWVNGLMGSRSGEQ